MPSRRSLLLAALAVALTAAPPRSGRAAEGDTDTPRAPDAPVADAGPGRAVAAPRATTTYWSHGDPSDEEQLLLELMNRARRDPSAEADRVFADYGESVVTTNVDYYVKQRPGVEFTRTESRAAFRSYAAKPPFAFDARLIEAARKHSLLAKQKDGQSHQFPGELDTRSRLEAEGYSGTFIGESVFSYAKNMVHAHAGFSIDWGQPVASGDTRPTLGHRASLMDFDGSRPYVQAGVGVVTDTDTGTQVGPRIVTIDFAAPQDGARFVTGICWTDLDADGFYDPGEGLGGVTITSPASAYHTLSSASGGYALPVPANAGAIQVTATGAAFGPSVAIGTQTVDVTMSGQNVKADFTAAVVVEPPFPAAQAFTSTVPVTITEGGTVEATVDVALFDLTSATLGDVDVDVALTHPDASQLKISVLSPAGTEVVLFDHGLPLADLEGTFDDTFAAVADLRTLAGQDYAGTWTLRVQDDAAAGAGSIRRFGVKVRPSWVRPIAALRTNLSLTTFQAKDVAKPGKDSIRVAATIDVGGAPFDRSAPAHLRLLRTDGTEIQRFDVAALGAVTKVKTGVRGTSRNTVSFVLTKLDLAGPLPSPLTVELSAGGTVARETIRLKKGAYAGTTAPEAPLLRIDLLKSTVGTTGTRTTTVQGRAVGGTVTGVVEVFVGAAHVTAAADTFTQRGTKISVRPTVTIKSLVFDTRTGAFTLKIAGTSDTGDPLVDGAVPFRLRLGPAYFADAVVVPAVAGTSRSY